MSCFCKGTFSAAHSQKPTGDSVEKMVESPMPRQSSTPQDPRLYAQKKVMDLLSRRAHSEKELREKLQDSVDKAFPEQNHSAVIDQAIALARAKNWLEDAKVLAERMAESLHRKNKGILYINSYLQEKGLPQIPNDDDLELEKARALVKNKYSDFGEKRQARLARFLTARGFDAEIVRKVIYEKL